MKPTLVLFTLLICQSLCAYAIDFSSVSLRQLKPSAYEAQLIEDDAPILSYSFDEHSTIWLLGQRFIWRWSVLTGAVQKIEHVLLETKSQNKTIHAVGQQVYVATSNNLFVLNVQDMLWQSMRTGLATGCQNQKFVETNTSTLIANDCGLYQIDMRKEAISRLNITGLSFPLGHFYGDVEQNRVFVTKGDELHLLEPSNKDTKLIYRAKSRIIGMTINSGYLYAWTSYAVVLFDQKTLKRVHVLPVLAPRRLMAADFHGDLHGYIFQDGVTEWYSLSQEKAWTSQLKVHDFQSMQLNTSGQIVVIDTKPLPTVFGLGALGF